MTMEFNSIPNYIKHEHSYGSDFEETASGVLAPLCDKRSGGGSSSSGVGGSRVGPIVILYTDTQALVCPKHFR